MWLNVGCGLLASLASLRRSSFEPWRAFLAGILEAQPDVLSALKGASRSKTVQRSIQLTPFGRDFCDAALPVDTAEIDALEI